MGEKVKECTVCGAEFVPEHGNKRMCPECTNAIQRSKGRNLPRAYDNPRNIEEYESKVKARYMERYHDTIVAIGYADRQRASTLKMAGKIDINL